MAVLAAAVVGLAADAWAAPSCFATDVEVSVDLKGCPETKKVKLNMCADSLALATDAAKAAKEGVEQTYKGITNSTCETGMAKEWCQDGKYKKGAGCGPWCEFAAGTLKAQMCKVDAPDCKVSENLNRDIPKACCEYMRSVLGKACDATQSQLNAYAEYSVQTGLCLKNTKECFAGAPPRALSLASSVIAALVALSLGIMTGA